MNYIDNYDGYFKNFAINQAEIRHTEEKKAYFSTDIQSVYGGLKSSIKPEGLCLVAIQYIASGDKAWAGDPRMGNEGGFLVIGTEGRCTDAERVLLQGRCERVAVKIISRMIQDSRAGHLLWWRSMNDLQNFTIEFKKNLIDGTYHGVMVTFSWVKSMKLCVESIDWDDLQN